MFCSVAERHDFKSRALKIVAIGLEKNARIEVLDSNLLQNKTLHAKNSMISETIKCHK